MSKLEILCPVMNQTDFSKIEEMKIKSDVVFANQADNTEYSEKLFDNFTAKMITTTTRGASVNRNLAIMYSSADIVIFSDDDQEFVEGYADAIVREFKGHPEADAIKFYCISTDAENPLSYKQVKRFKKASLRNLMKAGPAAFAIKREVLLKKEIRFSENVGPGRKYYCGEDSFFLKDIIDKKVRVYESPVLISYIHHTKSTWYEGYTEQYFITIGYIYARLYGKLAILASIRRAVKMNNEVQTYTLIELICLMRRGIKEFRAN